MDWLLFDAFGKGGEIILFLLAAILIIVGVLAVVGISSTVVLIILLRKKKKQTEAEAAAKATETGSEQPVSPVAEAVVESPEVAAGPETGES